VRVASSLALRSATIFISELVRRLLDAWVILPRQYVESTGAWPRRDKGGVFMRRALWSGAFEHFPPLLVCKM